jgi:hypothetical protein
MQSFRPGEPFTQLELAFGYSAFIKWMEISLQKQHNNSPDFYEFYEGCNHSAREVATKFIDMANKNQFISSKLERHYGKIDNQKEMQLAGKGLLSSFNPDWNSSLTRAVIMVCRQLAYLYTGIMGDTFGLVGKGISWVELNEASSIWLSEVLGS